MKDRLFWRIRNRAATCWGGTYLLSIYVFALVYSHSGVPFVQSTAIYDQNIERIEKDLSILSERALNQVLSEVGLKSDLVRIRSAPQSPIFIQFFLEQENMPWPNSERVQYSGLLVPTKDTSVVDAHGTYRGSPDVSFPMNGNYISISLDQITRLDDTLSSEQKRTEEIFRDYLSTWQSKVDATDHTGNRIFTLERMGFGSLSSMWVAGADTTIQFSQVSEDLSDVALTLLQELNGSIDPTTSRIRMLYFSTATATTLGYGDIVPVDDKGRLIVVIQSILSVILVGLFLNSVGSSRRSDI